MTDHQEEPQKITSNEKNKTEKLLALTISEGLDRLCDLYDRAANPEWGNIWCEHLADMPPAGIAWAFRQLEKTFIPTKACPFPVPAHVRNLLEHPAKLNRERDAETAWQEALKLIQKHYHPDLGWRDGAQFPVRMHRAIEAAGGHHYLFMATTDKLLWAKKEFVANYLRDAVLEDQYGDPPPEIKKLLAETIKTLL